MQSGRARARRGALACVLALGIAVTTGARAELQRSAEFVDAVNGSIEKGASWLQAAVRQGAMRGGIAQQYPVGARALTYLTLRVCEVPRENEQLAALYEELRTEYAKARKGKRLGTYAVALTMMAIEHHGHARSRDESKGDVSVTLERPDERWMEDCVDLLESWQKKNGAWWYGAPGMGPNGERSNLPKRVKPYDFSNTQYALLGLKSAARCAVKVRSDTWRSALDHLIASQQSDGPLVARFVPGDKGRTSDGTSDAARGWAYTGAEFDAPPEMQIAGSAYGSMTTGGVSSLVICRSELLGRPRYPSKVDDAAEKAIRDGLAWLGLNFTVRGNPGLGVGAAGAGERLPAGPQWHYYYLYGLERAARLARVDHVGEHDWYGAGARHLIDAQRGDGSWQGTVGLAGGNLTDTCFALLFLRRGTPTVAQGALTKSQSDEDINFDIAGSLQGKDFEDFLDLLLARWRRAPDDAALHRLGRRTAEVGERVVFPLVRRLSDADEAVRSSAHAMLHAVTGRSDTYDAGADPADREDAIAGWEMWMLTNAGKLRFDPELGRLEATK